MVVRLGSRLSSFYVVVINQHNQKIFGKRRTTGRTINREPHSPATPYEDGLHYRLRDPEYAGLYLASARDEESETPGAMEMAIQDVIRANADYDTTVAVFSLMLVVEFMTAEAILDSLDLLLSESPHQVRSSLVLSGFAKQMRDLADSVAAGERIFLQEIGIVVPVNSPQTRQLQNAFAAAA